MKRLLAGALVFAALIGRGAETLRIGDATGSRGGAVAAMLYLLAARNGEVEVSVNRLDAASALEKFDAGDFDVVLVNDRDLPEAKKRSAFRYAVKAYIAVVGVKNPLRGLGKADLRLLLDTPNARWELCGGPDVAVRRCGAAGPDGRPEGLEVLDLKTVPPGMLMFESMNEAAFLAGADPAALAWGPYASQLPLSVTALAVDGAAPTRANIRSGRYPLCIGRWALGREKPGRAAAEFLRLLRSAEFARLAEDDGEIAELPGAAR